MKMRRDTITVAVITILALMASSASAGFFKAALGSERAADGTGQAALAWYANDVAPTATLEYDISGLGVGGTATKLSLYIESLNGSNLGVAAGNGIAVVSGTVNSWEPGEDLRITASLLDGSDADVTAGYYLDLVGAALRWRVTATPVQAVFNGETVTVTLPAIGVETFSLATGQTAETVLNASRINAGTAQLGMLAYDITAVPEPSTAGLAGVAVIALCLRRRFAR
jgi:hypothetical protein